MKKRSGRRKIRCLLRENINSFVLDSTVTGIVRSLLSAPKKIVITSHVNPDGDAVGSSLGLFWFLKSLGHNVYIAIPNSFPSFLTWMPGCDQILHHKDQILQSKEHIASADIIFCLDFNALNRLDILEESVRNAKGISWIDFLNLRRKRVVLGSR